MSKEKFQLEYNLKSVSLNLLWNSLSTSSGLEEWFADKVVINGKKYIFTWSGNEQEAELVTIRMGSFIRLRWMEDINEKYYFEFKITIDELTEELALMITDFAEPEDLDDAKKLWNKQINDLFRSIGI